MEELRVESPVEREEELEKEVARCVEEEMELRRAELERRWSAQCS